MIVQLQTTSTSLSSSSFSTRTRSSTISLSKLEFSSSALSGKGSCFKASTPPSDTAILKFDSGLTPRRTCPPAASLRSFDSIWPQAPRSPLSLPDGEEGNERYRMWINWLNSQPSEAASTTHPPNVTIRHVEGVCPADEMLFREESFQGRLSPRPSRGSLTVSAASYSG